jgi:hypothetical protein
MLPSFRSIFFALLSCVPEILLQRRVCHLSPMVYSLMFCLLVHVFVLFHTFCSLGFFFLGFWASSGFSQPVRGFILFIFLLWNLIDFCSWACSVHLFQLMGIVFFALCLFFFFKKKFFNSFFLLLLFLLME